jgi:D-inositol-3-phosphate glycosyltransferase
VRILLVSANFRPHVGGIERFTEILAGGLADRGHDVAVLCCRSGDAPLRERLDGFDVYRVPSTYLAERRLNVPWPVPDPARLLRVLRQLVPGADVIHVQDAIYATSSATLLGARRHRVPSVLTQHVAFVRQRSRVLDAVEHGALGTLGRCSRLATIVATLNPAVAEWAAEEWGLRDVRVLPVGIPPIPSDGVDRDEIRQSFGLPPDRFLALFVGRDVPKKGLDVYLGATDPAFHLVAVTDRPPGARLDGATLIPFMSSHRLQQLLASVDAFVLPSEGEGFPISLQEALAHGLPVVTTMQPGYEQYLAPDDVLFVERSSEDVRNALGRLVCDEELRRLLAERSAGAAERNFGVDRFVTAYEEVYAEARARS